MKFFIKSHIELVQIATETPRANGQVESMNWCITSILSQKSVPLNEWEKRN